MPRTPEYKDFSDLGPLLGIELDKREPTRRTKDEITNDVILTLKIVQKELKRAFKDSKEIDFEFKEPGRVRLGQIVDQLKATHEEFTRLLNEKRQN